MRLAVLPLLAILATAPAGCGLHDPYRKPPAAATPTAPAPPAPAPPVTAPPVTAPPANTTPPATAPGAGDVERAPAQPALLAHPTRAQLAALTTRPETTLATFALAYSTNNGTARQAYPQLLKGLATPRLAGPLTRVTHGPSAVPAGARLAAKLTTLVIAPGAGAQHHGVVTVSQQLDPANAPPEKPISTTYTATLTHTPHGWRVALFTAQIS